MEKTTGQKLIALREGKGLTREQLAQELSVTGRQISDWENDKIKIDGKNAEALCAFFAVGKEELFGQQKPPVTRMQTFVSNRFLPAILVALLGLVMLAMGAVLIAAANSPGALAPLGGAIALTVIATLIIALSIFMFIKSIKNK